MKTENKDCNHELSNDKQGMYVCSKCGISLENRGLTISDDKIDKSLAIKIIQIQIANIASDLDEGREMKQYAIDKLAEVVALLLKIKLEENLFAYPFPPDDEEEFDRLSQLG